METIKIQINHKEPLTLKRIANILNYSITDENYQQLNELIKTLWNENE